MKKLFAIAFVPGLVMAILFVFWGDFFEDLISPEKFNSNFSLANAWLIALLLMLSDLFLPIPASAVMSAIGSKYGLLTGFTINFTSLLLSGYFAYFTARLLSHSGAKWICSQDEIQEYKSIFDRWGGLSIIVSRALPILPEVTSLMAGFTSMDLKKYSISLALGSLPVALLYSWLGSTTATEPVWGIAAAVTIPLLLWIPLNKLLSRDRKLD